MADKFFRLVCFLVDICPEVLREYFVNLAKNDTRSNYTTVGAYLAFRQNDVCQLLKKNKAIRKDQYDLLYPNHGTVDEKQWDVSLLVTLITELFATSLKPLEIIAMKNEIREIRNKLQHYPNTANMSDEDFDEYWERLDSAIMFLANNKLSPRGVSSLKDKINRAKCNNLPNIGDCLRSWYEERMKRYEDKIDRLESELSDIKSKTTETNDILRQVTVQKPGPSGDKDKRIKTADNILARLQAAFESMMNELPQEFIAPKEVEGIRTTLRNCHHVVVTGSNNSRYLETALAAIKGMDYNFKRCVEMYTAADWIHIDPKDVDLVVCRDPFGSFSYDVSKAKSMADIFNSMIHSTKEGNGDKTLDIIIVTDLKILEEIIVSYDHEILEEVVKVFIDTSLSQPADLTTGCSLQTPWMSTSSLPLSRNLGVMTRNFLNANKVSSAQIDKIILRKAKEKLKAHKAIVITGPKGCGKTSIAAALASSYETTQCLLLTEPNDIKDIDIHNICLVIVDEFAGKYRFEEYDVHKWYRMFEHLYNAVIAGQMNVVITCETSKLDKCVGEIGRHAILDQVVDVPAQSIVIKQEQLAYSPREQEQYPPNENGNLLRLNRKRPRQIHYSNAKKLRSSQLVQIDISIKTDWSTCDINGSCILPSGEILLVDNFSNNLIKLNSSYEVTSVCNLHEQCWDVCYVGDNVAVVSLFTKLHFVDTRHMRKIKDVDIEYIRSGLAYYGDRIYVRDCFGKVYVHSKDGIKQQCLYSHGCNVPLFSRYHISVSVDGSKLYLPADNNLVTIDNTGNELSSLYHPHINENSAICEDNHGNVFISTSQNNILQISADGRTIVGEIRSNLNDIRTLLFDSNKAALVVAGFKQNIGVMYLE